MQTKQRVRLHPGTVLQMFYAIAPAIKGTLSSWGQSEPSYFRHLWQAGAEPRHLAAGDPFGKAVPHRGRLAPRSGPPAPCGGTNIPVTAGDGLCSRRRRGRPRKEKPSRAVRPEDTRNYAAVRRFPKARARLCPSTPSWASQWSAVSPGQHSVRMLFQS